MKKIFLALALSASFAAQAQITAERRYAHEASPGKLSNGDVKYAGYVASNATTGQVRIYNLNHSVYRLVPVTLPAGASVGGVQYLSDRLFNTNANVEFVLNLSNINPAGVDGTRIFDETGTLLLAVDSASYPFIYNTPAGTKMQLNNYNTANATTRIFSLGGTLTALKTVASSGGAELAQAYPNPATAEIRLPYEVKPGQLAQLVVRDVAGRQVARYQVDHAFDHLLLDTRALRPGVYFYTVDAGVARRFIIQ